MSSSVSPLSPLQQRLEVARERASKDREPVQPQDLVQEEQPEQPLELQHPQAPQQQPGPQPLSPVQQRLQAARECAAVERDAIDRGNRLASARAAAKAERQAADDGSGTVIRSSGRCGACAVM